MKKGCTSHIAVFAATSSTIENLEVMITVKVGSSIAALAIALVPVLKTSTKKVFTKESFSATVKSVIQE
jgi:hypothetical protein